MTNTADDRASRYHGELPPSPGMVLDDGIWVDRDGGPWTEVEEERWATLAALRAHAVNALTRAVALDGLTLTFAEADELGEETIAWMRTRLELRVEETDRGVVCTSDYQSTETVGARQEV